MNRNGGGYKQLLFDFFCLQSRLVAIRDRAVPLKTSSVPICNRAVPFKTRLVPLKVRASKNRDTVVWFGSLHFKNED